MTKPPARIVVKVGSSTLTDAHGRIDRGFIADLAAQLAEQRRAGRDVLLVSSGAIRAGRERLQSVRHASVGAPAHMTIGTDSLPYKQAAAAVGQGLLMHTYTEAFAWREVECAQVLLTRDDLGDRRRFLNARNTVMALLALGVVPVINENDTVAVEEIKFGDNDALAAMVATLVEADLLIILSDVEGLYARPPANGEESGPPIPVVERIDGRIMAMAGASASGAGTGGMRTKLQAARIATTAGIRTCIVRGRRDRVVSAVVAGEAIGTTVLPQAATDRLPARKQWIAHAARARGRVTVNAPARDKLLTCPASLLAVGIVGVDGTFDQGDLIEIRDEDGAPFARGLTNYAAAEIRRVMGLRSEQFESALGYRGFDEIVHRDNLVVVP